MLSFENGETVIDMKQIKVEDFVYDTIYTSTNDIKQEVTFVSTISGKFLTVSYADYNKKGKDFYFNQFVNSINYSD